MTDSPIARQTAAPTTRQIAIAAAIDVVSVIAFVVIGRKNHDEGSSLTATAKVAAPFLLALVAGWAAARAWKAPMAVASGVVIWLVTVVLGMVLRKVAFDGGTALPFIIVATGFTLLCLVGWRMLAEWRAERAATRD
jgi:uncharacterized membrane protein (GlpM family)